MKPYIAITRASILLLTALAAAPAIPAQVPQAVTAVGDHGEDLYDALTAANWPKARLIADSLVGSAHALPSRDARLEPQRAPLTAQIDTLRRAIARRERYVALEAANQVTYLAATMTRPYRPRTPAEVSLLDFYGRELEIWGAQQNMTNLARTTTDIRATWNAVRSAVESHGGTIAARAMERDVERVERARTPAEFLHAAKPVLDQVDVLESVFSK